MIVSAINTEFQNNNMLLKRIYPVGALQNKIGYDILKTTSKELYKKIKDVKWIKKSHIDFNTEALLSNGEIAPVKIILWKESRFNVTIGCVVFESEGEDLKNALELQETQSLA